MYEFMKYNVLTWKKSSIDDKWEFWYYLDNEEREFKEPIINDLGLEFMCYLPKLKKYDIKEWKIKMLDFIIEKEFDKIVRISSFIEEIKMLKKDVL